MKNTHVAEILSGQNAMTVKRFLKDRALYVKVRRDKDGYKIDRSGTERRCLNRVLI